MSKGKKRSFLSLLHVGPYNWTNGVLHEAALVVAQEAHQRSTIPIVIDAERKIEGLDELLHLATYIVCSTRFPQASYLLR
ncbi:hypothetical protein MTR67_036941 [Solanum verrucosum]|uniref:Uncharacterized protein n=1 Tax=Solanum verrucosum TaxID=315347 RepID=A0AAF0UDK0_SOLVR|nr:hypothetical protein MTR67_036941 [Solanum verrucosum]